MQKLNLPGYSFKIKVQRGQPIVYDSLRKRYVVLTPEEWVRQNFLSYLITELGYPSGLIAVEYSIDYNGLARRVDAAVFSREGSPLMLLEFKAPSITPGQPVFDQLARYTAVVRAPWLAVSNGLAHYCCKLDDLSGKYSFTKNLPAYSALEKQT